MKNVINFPKFQYLLLYHAQCRVMGSITQNNPDIVFLNPKKATNELSDAVDIASNDQEVGSIWDTKANKIVLEKRKIF